MKTLIRLLQDLESLSKVLIFQAFLKMMFMQTITAFCFQRLWIVFESQRVWRNDNTRRSGFMVDDSYVSSNYQLLTIGKQCFWYFLFEPAHEKTCLLHIGKQR